LTTGDEMQHTFFVALTLLAAAPPSAEQKDGLPELRQVTLANGVQLHYVERSKGVPVVFVHGTLGDYSVWRDQLSPFAERYRAIAYSRRYNYPNTNKLQANHSAVVEADDLASFILKLDPGKVHVVGHSYGAYAALLLAIKHPELVRTLTLAEAPIVFAGEHIDDAKQQLLKRARAAFAGGDPEEAVRTMVNSSRAGAYEKMPEPFRRLVLRNAPELKALVSSDNMYPPIEREAVRKIVMPTLLLCGERSPRSQKLIDDELEGLLPEKSRQHVIIRGADHGMWFQQAQACARTVLQFLRSH
jgi:pimeloyl-ACP methyl ester carboxylesterase